MGAGEAGTNAAQGAESLSLPCEGVVRPFRRSETPKDRVGKVAYKIHGTMATLLSCSVRYENTQV